MPTYGHHSQNTLGVLSAVSYSSFQVLKMRQGPSTLCYLCSMQHVYIDMPSDIYYSNID